MQPIVCLQENFLKNGVCALCSYITRVGDGHNNLPSEIVGQCKDVDQASAALITDLKQRGLLD